MVIPHPSPSVTYSNDNFVGRLTPTDEGRPWLPAIWALRGGEEYRVPSSWSRGTVVDRLGFARAGVLLGELRLLALSLWTLHMELLHDLWALFGGFRLLLPVI